MANYDNLTQEQKLRLTFEQDVKALCQESAQVLNLEFHSNSLALLGELAWRRLQIYATDLEHFAKHAKRSNINVDDVKLLVRRSPALKTYITHFAENSTLNSGIKRRRGTISSSTSNNEVTSANNKNKAKEPKKAAGKKDNDESVDTTIDLT